MIRIIIGLLLVAALTAACGGDEDEPTQSTSTTTGTSSGASSQSSPGGDLLQWSSPPAMTIDPDKRYFATMYTNEGEITFELFAKETPQTVNNFVFLTQQGFYNEVPSHRILKGFMIQSGDPTGTGTGGPGYRFNDEPISRDYLRGTLAMANAGPNTNGSQFFIMHQDYALPKNYVIFGLATEGLAVIDRIADTPVGNNGQGEISKPATPVTIHRIEIREE